MSTQCGLRVPSWLRCCTVYVDVTLFVQGFQWLEACQSVDRIFCVLQKCTNLNRGSFFLTMLFFLQITRNVARKPKKPVAVASTTNWSWHLLTWVKRATLKSIRPRVGWYRLSKIRCLSRLCQLTIIQASYVWAQIKSCIFHVCKLQPNCEMLVSQPRPREDDDLAHHDGRDLLWFYLFRDQLGLWRLAFSCRAFHFRISLGVFKYSCLLFVKHWLYMFLLMFAY